MKKVSIQFMSLALLLILVACNTTDKQQGQAPVNQNKKNLDVMPVTPEVNYPVVINLAEFPRVDYANRPEMAISEGVHRGSTFISEEQAAQLRADSLNLPPNNNIQTLLSPEVGMVQGPIVAVPELLNSFDGPQFYNSTPPDHEFTVGKNYVIGVTNGTFMILDKAGNPQGGPVDYDVFFASVAECANGTFDPNAYYDEEQQRYIIGTAGNGVYCFAVSTSENLSGGGTFNLYGFTTIQNVTDFFDYPHMGVGNEALFMGANIFLNNGFRADVWAIDKFAAYAGNALPMPVRKTLNSGADTPQPMNINGFAQGTLPLGDTHYILADGVFNGTTLSLYSWQDPFGANIFSNTGNINLNAASGVTAGYPIDQPQAGSGGDLQGNDWRVLDAEYRNGSIWMAHTIACNPGSGTVNCVRWAEIDINNGNGPIVEQAGVIAIDGEYLSFPDVAVNACEDMTIGFSRTSPSIFPGIAFTGRLGSDPLNQVRPVQIQKQGEVTYRSFEGSAPRRWGDYSEAASDPDGVRTWFMGVYAADNIPGSTNWVTNIGEFTTNCSAPTYSIGGSVTGLAAGNTVTLQNNATDDLVVNGNGGFTFATELAATDSYNVTVSSQPTTPNQNCSVSNGSGNINGANVTNVVVNCTINTYTVGGQITGLLAGQNVVLQNNGGDNLLLNNNGAFEFAGALNDGSTYAVTVLTQPTAPNQTCVLSNAGGTLAGADVTNVAVNCTINTYTVGGQISGLLAGQNVVLQNNGGDNLLLNNNGAFEFAGALNDGSTFAVTVLTQPTNPNQICVVSNGSGTLAGADVTNIAVNCSSNSYTVGGTLSGLLDGLSVVLQNNGADDLVLTANGAFTFATEIPDFSGYEVTVLSAPNSPIQNCLVSNSQGNMAGQAITDVAVDCDNLDLIYKDGFSSQ